MSVLGVVVRTHPQHLAAVLPRLNALPGLDLVANPGDGRLVLVLEDQPDRSAAACLGDLAQWPELWSTTLVYEYSGPDSPSPHSEATDWRHELNTLDTSAARPASTASSAAPLAAPIPS
ncbi:chaperone NapD [Roseateles paludis]|jgi:nitrate reductase NapAB chaperone NapD|uniref:Chaperone NapD n=1 Tax=Roseateles paludis TaxID=3145238 RepID=A0ABV0G622_9BURK